MQEDYDTPPQPRQMPEGYLTPTAMLDALTPLEVGEKYHIPAAVFTRTSRPYISRAGRLLRRGFSVRKTPHGYNVWRMW